MQKINILVFFFIHFLIYNVLGQAEHSPTYQASETRYFDLIHTKLNVSFDWERQYLKGEAWLTLSPLFYPQQVIVLDAKGMAIEAVKEDNEEGQSLNYSYDDMLLSIDLSKLYKRQDTIGIYIDYVARPNKWDARGSAAITSDKGLYFINPTGSNGDKPRQIWTQGETEASSIWFPTIDAPNERCTQQISITVDNDFKTLSNGLLVEQASNLDGSRTDTWLLNQPHAPYLFMMAVGKFEVIEDRTGDIPLAYYVDPEYQPYANDIFGNTPEMISYFSELLDYPFPWPKYSQVVVHDFVSGAMENTSASVFMEDLHVTSRELIDFNWDGIIAHELFHQWFGNLVTCESWSNLTLNEGFANYSEYLWKEYKYGRDEADYHLLGEYDGYFTQATTDPKQLIRYFYNDREDMFDAHSYNKGGAVLHMLRNYLGDELFFSGLNKYLKDNAYQAVEIDHLRLSFENVSGQDLNWFFDQWYLSPGHPLIQVEQAFKNDTLSLSVNQLQDLEQSMVFKLPVFIDIWTNGESHSFPIVLTQPNEIYKFPITDKPDFVVFDSERHILAKINHAKSEKELAAQFKFDPSLYGRLEVMDSLSKFNNKKLVSDILTRAFEDPYYAIRQSALDYLQKHRKEPGKYKDFIANLLNDSSSSVRSTALNYVGEQAFKSYEKDILGAINDSSYLVVGTALAVLFQNEIHPEEEILKHFSQSKNINIALAMARYYLKKNNQASYDWFDKKVNEVKNAERYYFLQAYAEKMMLSSADQKKRAVDILVKIAKEDSNMSARLGAYQTLMLFSDHEGVKKALSEIMKMEKNNQLKEWYEQM